MILDSIYGSYTAVRISRLPEGIAGACPILVLNAFSSIERMKMRAVSLLVDLSHHHQSLLATPVAGTNPRTDTE